MQIKALAFLSMSFWACQSNKNVDITGSWTSTNMIDNSGMNITDKVDFNNDGSFAATIFSNRDSVANALKGSYEIDKDLETLTIIINGVNFKHEIIELESENLKIKTSQGIMMELKKIK